MDADTTTPTAPPSDDAVVGASAEKETDEAVAKAEVEKPVEPARLAWTRLAVRQQWAGEEAKLQAMRLNLSPPWRMFVLGDGSPTRHLHLLTGSPTAVDVLDMTVTDDLLDGAPADISRIAPPRIRRQVFLRNERGERLGYATSWWNAAECEEQLTDRKLPIWKSLAAHRTEIFREILWVYLGDSPTLEEAFGFSGPFYGRSYLFWHSGKPMCLIYEVFSPALAEYLGPVTLSPSPTAASRSAPAAAKKTSTTS